MRRESWHDRRLLAGIIAVAAAVSVPAFGAVPTGISPADYATAPSLHTAFAQAYDALSWAEKKTKVSLSGETAWRIQSKADSNTNNVPVRLSWTGMTGPCTVAVVEALSGKTLMPATVTDGTSIDVYDVEVGRNYLWTLRNGGDVVTNRFYTPRTLPRLLNSKYVSGMGNCRDLGGYLTANGKVVRQGMIFRNGHVVYSALKEIEDDSGKIIRTEWRPMFSNYWNNVVGLKTEIDLRKPSYYQYENDEYLYTGSPFGPAVTFWNAQESTGYAWGYYADVVTKAASKNALKTTFLKFCDAANYPIDFHCSQGRDRTGTLAFFLLGTLGVSLDDIYVDYTYTDFSETDDSYDGSIEKLYNALVKAYPTATYPTLQDKCVAHLKALGVTDAQILAFQTLLLEDEEEPLSAPPEDPSVTTWRGAAAGDFGTAANWSNGLPAAGRRGVFAPDSTNAVTMAAAQALGTTYLAFGTRSVTTFTGAYTLSSVMTDSYTLLDEGAALISQGGNGSSKTIDFQTSPSESKSAILKGNTAIRALDGAYIKLYGDFDDTATNVTVHASSAADRPQSIVSFYPVRNLKAANRDMTFIAEGNAKVSIGGLRSDGDTWNPGQGSGGSGANVPSVTFIERNGGSFKASDTYVNGAKMTLEADNGAAMTFDGLKVLAAGSSIRLHNTSVVANYGCDLGANELTIWLSGTNATISAADCAMNLGANLTLRLKPDASWSPTTGRFRQTSAAKALAVAAGVRYEIDVSSFAGSKTTNVFCLAQTAGTGSYNMPAKGNVTLVGAGAEDFEVTFSSTAKLMKFTLATKAFPAPTVGGVSVEPADVFSVAGVSRPISYPSAPVVEGGVAVDQRIVYGGVAVDVPVYYKATQTGNVVTLDWTSRAKPAVAAEGGNPAFVVEDGKVRLHVANAWPALYYALSSAALLSGPWTTGPFVQGKTDFEVACSGEESRFYRIVVRDDSGK